MTASLHCCHSPNRVPSVAQKHTAHMQQLLTQLCWGMAEHGVGEGWGSAGQGALQRVGGRAQSRKSVRAGSMGCPRPSLGIYLLL